MAVGRKTPTASEDAVKCHLAAREMLRDERVKAFAAFNRTRDRKQATDDATHAVEKSTRAYDKLLGRLKQNEGMMSRESTSIESWVGKGRDLTRRLPKTSAALMNSGSRQLDEIDRKWELFLEEDVVDVLDGK